MMELCFGRLVLEPLKGLSAPESVLAHVKQTGAELKAAHSRGQNLDVEALEWMN